LVGPEPGTSFWDLEFGDVCQVLEHFCISAHARASVCVCTRARARVCVCVWEREREIMVDSSISAGLVTFKVYVLRVHFIHLLELNIE
jgi:hypothetical protein